MQQLMYKMVARMLVERDALSRNKNFAAFDDPRLARATRIVRHLRALQEDLRVAGPRGCVRITRLEGARDGRHVCLEIDQPEIRGSRRAILNDEEVRLLCLDPEVEALVRKLTPPPRSP